MSTPLMLTSLTAIDDSSEEPDAYRRSTLYQSFYQLLDQPSAATLASITDVKGSKLDLTHNEQPKSSNSDVSKEDDRRPPEQPNPVHAQKLLKKVFNSEYQRGLEILLIERVYRLLPTCGQEHVSRNDIQRHCIQAISGSSLIVSNKELLEIINGADKSRTGQCSADNFSHVSKAHNPAHKLRIDQVHCSFSNLIACLHLSSFHVFRNAKVD